LGFGGWAQNPKPQSPIPIFFQIKLIKIKNDLEINYLLFN